MCTRLYDILGVKPEATYAEITKAYRLRALKLHPDKQPNEQSANAFIHLQEAYEVLRDPSRRKRYDQSGLKEEETDDFQSAYNYFRDLFPEVRPQDIENFSATYKHSQEEKDDLEAFFIQNDGNVSNLLDFIPLSEPEDIPRFLCIFADLIKSKRIKATSKYKASIAKLEKSGEAYKRRVKREGAEVSSANATKNEDSLAEAILKKRQQRGGWLEELEKKYSTTSNVSKRRKKK